MEEKKGRGRPRIVDKLPEGWKEIIIESGKEGKHITNWLIKLGISWEQHYRMLERNTEYSKIVNEYKKYCEEYWFEMARDHMVETGGAAFNSRMWSLLVRNMFPKNWSESTKVDLTTQGEKIENKPISIEIVRPKND